jgi:hypothetical protein
MIFGFSDKDDFALAAIIKWNEEQNGQYII